MKGWRVLVTRPDAAALARRLRARGAVPIAIPMIELRGVDPGGPLDAAARGIGDHGWVVVTSANGARALFERLRTLDIEPPAGLRWAAVGPATAAALEAEGVRVERVPEAGTGSSIADELGELAGVSVLLPRTRIASDELPSALAARGAIVHDVPAYDTVIGPESSREPLVRALDAGLQAVFFTSGSTVEGFSRLAGDPRAALSGVATVCIGPATARALEEVGVEPSRVTSVRSPEALVDALEEVAHARA
ncbi:MAG TPA: uroporphyrinogen-III synthase [Gemmatimonadota bacterium]|nr:uroporphyrinogen-III synthase [Gemmatimonadota bacterium]